MSTFNPTPAEIALTSQVFTLADPQGLGIVTGDTAVKILSGANLSHAVLGEVWTIADKDNNGFLTKKGVAIALRLIGYAQKGESVAETLLDKPGPLAHIDGVSKPPAARSPAPSSPTPQSPSLNPSSTLPQLTQGDKTKFLKLFIGCGPVNGMLTGEKARDVFVKSKLPYEKLSHIWALADSKTRGALDSTDFTIGMYLIQACMTSPSLTLPLTLPNWIYIQAAQSLDGNASAVVSHATGGSASVLGSPVQSYFPRQHTGSGAAALGSSAIKTQYTGQQPLSPTTTGFSRTSVSPPPPVTNTRPFAQPWGVSAESKASSDGYFDNLDSQRRGYIEGDVAVPFLVESNLPENELAQIWDLADLSNDGRLTREGFAVALHLIKSRLAGAEIPSILPSSLVPPSMRPFQPATTVSNPQPQLDLLLDDTPPSSAIQPQHSSGSGSVQSTPSRVTGHNTGNNALSPPFQNAFSSSAQTQHFSTFTSAMNRDLLDDDDETSKADNLPDNSAEIGNLRNQLSSTTRSLETTQAERTSTEQQVTQQALQLSQLQTQLSSARASFDTESQLLASLRQRLSTQRTEIQKLREELITAESELSATKVEKAEVEGSVLRDKEDVRELQRKMKEVGLQTEALKASIEKTKKDARQQKGLLAIAKKQLATSEAEKVKSSKELEAAQKELDDVQKEKETVEAQIAELELETNATPSLPHEPTRNEHIASPAPSAFAAGIPLPDTPHSTTPQPSAARQSTNPFERLAMAATASTTPSALPASSPLIDNIPSKNSSDFDPFGFSSPVVDPAVPPAQPLRTFTNDSEAVEPNGGVPAHFATSPASPTSILSPNNDLPFLTPPSTANPEETSHTIVSPPWDISHISPSSQQEQLFPGAYPSAVEDEHVLSPLREIEETSSDTSDSDDEPLGIKAITLKNEGHGSSDVVPPVKADDNHVVSGLDASTSSKSAFDDTFGVTSRPTNPPVATKASPTTSGKSSPRRSRSPGRALSTRTLSSHSIAGAMDPFGASSFSQTPLEPPAGEVAPPPTIEAVLGPTTNPPIASNINDFDEALGKLPSSTKNASSAFKFDSAFDDNFDFSSSAGGGSTVVQNGAFDVPHIETTAAAFPPVSAPLTPTKPAEAAFQTTGISTAQTNIPSFDSSFPSHPSGSTNGAPVVSFDDAFGLNASIVANGNGQHVASNEGEGPLGGFGGTFEPPAGNSFSVAEPPRPELAEARSPSPPPRLTTPTIRSASPAQPRVSSRTTSPTPRASSPRVRALSNTKASSSENKTDMPSKHKLSVR
ncbi:hypothetical protein K439DRAFT_1628134 [Ramaria rubella]|nr:hypothetical protein K439DRAFT_1642406 [Ramaria rubella]KAF8589921.1 hypothetical protein K439DRAFT_1628134 [Ramaria rubella]